MQDSFTPFFFRDSIITTFKHNLNFVSSVEYIKIYT